MKKNTTTKKSPTVLRRKKNIEHSTVIEDYIAGKLTVKQIAEKHSTSEENVGLIVQRHWKALTNMRESRALLAPAKESLKYETGQQKALRELRSTELINEEFAEELSHDESDLLTEAESIYAWTYVHTGDAIEALKLAKLDVGLYKERGKESRFSYDRALILRSHYLNAKPNVSRYIQELRETRYVEQDVSKQKVQGELLDQLAYLKQSGDPRDRKEILRCIELLGKTVGAFTERIEVREVNPVDALDKLIEMAQEAEVVPVDEKKVISST